MDSDSFAVINLFQQGSYESSIAAYKSLASPVPEVTLYAARALLALSPPAIQQALDIVSSVPPTLDSRAISALIQHLSGDTDESIEAFQEILADLGENGLQEGEEGRMVRSILGSVFIQSEETRDEGLEILKEATQLGQDQEALSVITHLYISLSHPTTAQSLLNSGSTKEYTSDSLLSQLLLAQTNLASGPSQKYQDAYYVYEEIKSMQGGRAVAPLNGLAVSQSVLGNWDEAFAAIEEALQINASHPLTLKNAVALAPHLNKPSNVVEEYYNTLETISPDDSLVQDLKEKSAWFDSLAANYVPVKA